MTDGAISRSAWRRWLGTYRSLSFIPHLVIPIPLLWAKTSRPIKITTLFMDSSSLSIKKRKKKSQILREDKTDVYCRSNGRWEKDWSMRFEWDLRDLWSSSVVLLRWWWWCQEWWVQNKKMTPVSFDLKIYFAPIPPPPLLSWPFISPSREPCRQVDKDYMVACLIYQRTHAYMIVSPIT